MKTIYLISLNALFSICLYGTNPVMPACPQCGYLTVPATLSTDESHLSTLQKSLSGSWEHTAMAPDIFVAEGLCPTREQAISARLTYVFQPDGRFEKILESPELGIKLTDQGRWQISGDSQYILLEYIELDAPYMEVVTIRHLDRDELVLEQRAAFHKASVQQPSQELFFNKQ